jgi:UDPglucose--hexose-1-phosphate uridylyltransferase
MSEVLRRHDLLHPDGRTFHVYGDAVGSLDGQSPETGFDVSHLHRRYDRLRDEWVLISPARNKRPGGKIAGGGDDACPLCPGGPELPWPYALAVFDNRFPSMAPNAPCPVASGFGPTGQPSAPVASSAGRCQVVVYSGAHDGSFATLPPSQFLAVLAVWRERTSALWAAGSRYVMAFENRGMAVGATLTHPHGQMYAFDHEPPTIGAKRAAHDLHRSNHGTCLGCTLLAEDAAGGRVVHANESFVASVPFAPHWPLEVQIRARRHGAGRLGDLSDSELRDLARLLHETLGRYDQVYGFELPLMLAVQEAPPAAPGTDAHPDWHLHVELLPPHRSETQLKVRAAVESVLGSFILDSLPEDTASRLASMPLATLDWPAVPRIEPALSPESHT